MRFDLPLLATLTAALGIAMLGGAFAFQHWGGLAPCVLCIYQRWPWVAVILLGSLAVVFRRRPAAAHTLLGLAALAMLVGAGIAGFHVGVEQYWWAGTAECSGVTGRRRPLRN